MDSRPDEVWLLLVALVLGFVGFGDAWTTAESWTPRERDEGVLRVVTWNVGSEVESQDSALRDEYLDAIAECLGRIDPDLVLLQEVAREDQARALLEKLAKQDSGRRDWSFVSTRDRGRRTVALGEGERLTGRSVPSGGQRAALELQYERRGAGRIAAIVLHAEAFSAAERNEAIGRAVERLRGLRGEGHLLAGDLNLDVDLDKRRDLLTDDVELDVQTYNFATEHLEDAGLGHGPTAEPDRRLDYLLFDPGELELVSAGPYRDQKVGDMDHDPLVADLRFRR